MKYLVACCDGTWNTVDQRQDGVPIPTNVVRLYNALADKANDGATPQSRYYHPGVGTEPGFLDRVSGGAAGSGLNKNIESAYQWLCANYEDGDRICLFGFSRGAYTVRSVAGFIARCGLLRLTGLPPKEVWDRIDDIFQAGYRDRQKDRHDWDPSWLHTADGEIDIPIYLIGVWDTVGALGIPDDLALLNLLDTTSEHDFHDTTLNPLVRHARHAVALDELRETFQPTLWEEPDEGSDDLKQLWFPGVHSDVGGGYRETGLSDGALAWMIDEAQTLGLGFVSGMVKQIQPDPLGVVHDSWVDPFKLLPSRPRWVPDLDDKRSPLHASAVARRKCAPISDSPYRPTPSSLIAGGSHECTVYGTNPWNPTGLWLEAGTTYEFEASGEWLDRDISSGPNGVHEGHFRPFEAARMLGSALGEVETLFRKVSGNAQADFQLTKRQERLGGRRVPWMGLVGEVASGRGVDPQGRLVPHEAFFIGSGCLYVPAASGYLYAYANDAWHFYDNNRGSVHLVVHRR